MAFITRNTCAIIGKLSKYFDSVILSTANPYKFSDTICKALNIKPNADEFDNIKQISSLTGVEADPRILALNKIKSDDLRTVWNLEDTYNNLKNVVGGLDD